MVKKSETVQPEPFIYESILGTTLEETQEAATPEITPQQAIEPSIPVLDLSSPQLSQEPSTPVLGLSSPTTSPVGTPVLHLTDEEEDIKDQDQPKDQWQDFYTPIFWTIIIIIFMFSV